MTAANGKSFSYDSENELLSMNGGAVQLMYDGDGNRVAKSVTSGGVTTTTYYLVDDLNPTSYPQVMDELTNGVVTRTYTYGLQRISEDQQVNGAWTPSFYSYDGMGSVRQLTNTSGTVTDSYEYDAFGNEITHTGTTPNNYLYRGEQFDPDLGLYYLRARYYNPMTDRFLSRDPLHGDSTNPVALHKYLYAGGDPVNASDPTGRAGTNTGVLGNPTGQYIALATLAIVIAAGYDATHPGAVRALGQEIVCAYDLLASETKAWVAVGLAGNGDAGTVVRTGACSAEAVEPECKPCYLGECDKWVQDNCEKGDQIITYRTVNPAPSCGGYGLVIFDDVSGLQISDTGMHQGILRGGTVYDNLNPEGIPVTAWSGGRYLVPLDCSDFKESVGGFNAAVARGIGTITVE